MEVLTVTKFLLFKGSVQGVGTKRVLDSLKAHGAIVGCVCHWNCSDEYPHCGKSGGRYSHR